MRSDLERLLDIQKAMHCLEAEVPKRPLHQLEPIVIAGILRYLQIIGEASAKVTKELKTKYPQVPWKTITRSRNVIVHHYFDVDMEIIESIFEKDLPLLKQQINHIIEQEQEHG